MEWTFAIIFVHDTIHFCPKKRKEKKFSGSIISSLSLFKLCFCFRTILWWDPLRKELEFHLRLIIIEHWWVLTKLLRGAQVRKEFDGSGNLKEGGWGSVGGSKGEKPMKKTTEERRGLLRSQSQNFFEKNFFFCFLFFFQMFIFLFGALLHWGFCTPPFDD
jgi:hypothetical protein